MPASRGSYAQVREHWDKQALRYDRAMDRIEAIFLGDSRQWICAQASGRTLEVAIGTGRNLAYYGPDVRLVGIDISPGMLAYARQRPTSLGGRVDLAEADAERLPFADGTFDTVVCTLSLCSVPDLQVALAELDRVLRPGGTLLLLDHVRPTSRPLRWMLRGLQWLVDRLQPAAGERFLRRPQEAVAERGYAIERQDRFKGGGVERLAARKPSGSAG